jgi:hypothetical protein
MIPTYLFQAEKFAVSEGNLHLLRNGFNYETIPFNSVISMEVRDGKDLKNWLWVLFVGGVLTGYALWDVFQVLFILNDPHTYHIYIERLLIPVIPMALGVYSIYIALRNTRVMIAKSSSKTYYLSLRALVKNQQFLEFTEYMKKNHPGFTNMSRY